MKSQPKMLPKNRTVPLHHHPKKNEEMWLLSLNVAVAAMTLRLVKINCHKQTLVETTLFTCMPLKRRWQEVPRKFNIIFKTVAFLG